MRQHLLIAAKLVGERIFFNFLTLLMVPLFIPIIDTFSAGDIIFSATVCSLYIGIAYDQVWKMGRHDRQSYATEKHYKLKGLSVGVISEIPFLFFYLLLLFFPNMRVFYRLVCIGAYMGFVPVERINAGYGLVLLIIPFVSTFAYMVGYKKPKDDAKRLSRKIMYKKK